MLQIHRRTRALSAAVALAVLVTAAPHAAPPATLPHLRGIDELKSWFNAGKGHPRLIFLVSPT